MPTVTYNGQSFAIDGRRLWILGASMQYSRIPPEMWASRIAAARQAGFNAIETSCPWLVHEPRPGRFVFDGPADVRRFIELCGEASMRVILRPGPFVGAGFEGGGLPSWLLEISGLALREANEPFLERVSGYFRRLFNELADMELSRGGPIILVQSEHAWLCASERQSDRYLREITRFIRESGVTVPVINANDLWQDSSDTIGTWRGSTDLLVHLRQLHAVQPEAPRVVSAFDAAPVAIWGEPSRPPRTPAAAVRLLAQILAAGAQPVVSPFHGGTSFGFLGGRLPGRADGFSCTTPWPGAPLAEDGSRTPVGEAIRRLVTFASHFGHVFAELDPDYHPISIDPGDGHGAEAHAGHRASAPDHHGVPPLLIVPLRGSQGQVVFVLADGTPRSTTLVLEDGIRMPVHLGRLGVGWYVLDVDLHGSGRLDYANLCPFAIVDRSIVVFHGPAGTPAYVSINGSPLETTVPRSGSEKPLVLDLKGMTIVICNEEQIDSTYCGASTVYVGAGGLDDAGRPQPSPAFATVWAIGRNASIAAHRAPEAPPRGRAAAARLARRAERVELSTWLACPGTTHATGESPRFATLDGPQSLTACGAPTGYGWYRLRLQVASARTHLCQWPRSGHRLHLFVDGRFRGVHGLGRGADPRPFDLRLDRGTRTLVVLAENFGRFSDGNDLHERCGLFGHLYSLKPLRLRAKPVTAQPADPFRLRGYIAGGTQGQLSDPEQVAWTLQLPRRQALLIEVHGARPSGTFVLNDQPVAYYAGATGACLDRILLDPAETGAFKRGRNVLRFAPDARQPDALSEIIRSTTIYVCAAALSEGAEWAFARWEPPSEAMFQPPSGGGGRGGHRGMPCWWRATFASPRRDQPLWFDAAGLSKGHLFLNRLPVGRYFTATADGKRVGPQERLFVPTPWVRHDGENELLVFDEHGFEPSRARLIAGGDRS